MCSLFSDSYTLQPLIPTLCLSHLLILYSLNAPIPENSWTTTPCVSHFSFLKYFFSLSIINPRRNSMYVVCCMLYVVCCMLYVVCCMLYVVCCMLYVVYHFTYLKSSNIFFKSSSSFYKAFILSFILFQIWWSNWDQQLTDLKGNTNTQLLRHQERSSVGFWLVTSNYSARNTRLKLFSSSRRMGTTLSTTNPRKPTMRKIAFIRNKVLKKLFSPKKSLFEMFHKSFFLFKSFWNT